MLTDEDKKAIGDIFTDQLGKTLGGELDKRLTGEAFDKRITDAVGKATGELTKKFGELEDNQRVLSSTDEHERAELRKKLGLKPEKKAGENKEGDGDDEKLSAADVERRANEIVDKRFQDRDAAHKKTSELDAKKADLVKTKLFGKADLGELLQGGSIEELERSADRIAKAAKELNPAFGSASGDGGTTVNGQQQPSKPGNYEFLDKGIADYAMSLKLPAE